MGRFLRMQGRGSRLEYNLVTASVLVFWIFAVTAIDDRWGMPATLVPFVIGGYVGTCAMARRMHDLGGSLRGFLHYGSEYPIFYLKGKSLSTTPGIPGENEWGWAAGARRPEKTGIPAHLVDD